MNKSKNKTENKTEKALAAEKEQFGKQQVSHSAFVEEILMFQAYTSAKLYTFLGNIFSLYFGVFLSWKYLYSNLRELDGNYFCTRMSALYLIS